MNQIQLAVEGMDPEEALAAMAAAAEKLFSLLGDDARLNFLAKLAGEFRDDKVASLVHLWLATCMGEGVDPTHMCRSLVDKVQRFEQLQVFADPDLLVLFEDWLEEIEGEVVSLIKETPSLDPAALGKKLGLSQAGAKFLIDKLQKEGRL